MNKPETSIKIQNDFIYEESGKPGERSSECCRLQVGRISWRQYNERESVSRLSQKDAWMVLSLLDNPPKNPTNGVKDAVKRFKGTVRA